MLLQNGYTVYGSMIAMNKSEIRKLIRSRHEGMEARNVQSEQICRHFLESELYRKAEVIGAYIPLRWEADILPVLRSVIRDRKTLALPLCETAPNMTLRRVMGLDDLMPGAYGIPEPDQHAPIISAEEVDVLLVPLEGIDRSGGRLGKGGGYYDKLLQDTDVTAVGCALSWQQVDRLPSEPWDVRLKCCLDQHGLHYFK